MKKIIIIFLFFILSAGNASSLIKVDITRGNLDPLPIAVSPLHIDMKSENYKSLKEKKLGEKISKII
jgi:TolB protein